MVHSTDTRLYSFNSFKVARHNRSQNVCVTMALHVNGSGIGFRLQTGFSSVLVET